MSCHIFPSTPGLFFAILLGLGDWRDHASALWNSVTYAILCKRTLPPLLVIGRGGELLRLLPLLLLLLRLPLVLVVMGLPAPCHRYRSLSAPRRRGVRRGRLLEDAPFFRNLARYLPAARVLSRRQRLYGNL